MLAETMALHLGSIFHIMLLMVFSLIWWLGNIHMESTSFICILHSRSLEDSAASLSHNFFHTSRYLSLTQLLHNQLSLTPRLFFQRANAKLVYACEWNPNAIEALQHNLQANSVSNRCIVLEGDNQITAPKAWKLWSENRAMELMDALMEKPIPASEVLRCIQVSLLCVQRHPEDRPPIVSVLLMLDSENSSLPQPKQPGFYTERSITETDSSSSGKTPYTATELTITMLQGR